MGEIWLVFFAGIFVGNLVGENCVGKTVGNSTEIPRLGCGN